MCIFKKTSGYFLDRTTIIITLEINKIFKLKDMFWLCSFLLFPKACSRIGFDYRLHSILSIYEELVLFDPTNSYPNPQLWLEVESLGPGWSQAD